MRRLLRPLLALASAALLSGCWWIGPAFYRPDPAAPLPLSSGRWSALNADGQVEEARLLRYPDGTIGPAPGEKQDKSRLVFHPLAVAGRSLWITQLIATDAPHQDSVYGLAEQRADGVDLLPLLDCEGSEALVRAAGGTVKVVPQSADSMRPDAQGAIDPKNVGTTCLFATASTLERALTAYATRHPRLDGAARLHRVGD